MNYFLITAKNVLLMLAYAFPGYVLIKRKVIKPESISAFAAILLFVNQPALSLYSLQQELYSPDLLRNMGIVLLISMLSQGIMMVVLWLIWRKKYKQDIAYRVYTAAAALGNVGFMGIPMLQALLPDFPAAVCYSAVYLTGMNILLWTLGAFLLTGKKEFISVKKALLNPAVLTLVVALPLFFTRYSIADNLPTVNSVMVILAKMSTPMCMLILGMRFGCVPLKKMFSEWRLYVNVLLKGVVFPLACLGIMLLLPLEDNLVKSIYIMACMPSASLVLSLSELFGDGQECACFCVLTSTTLSMVTVPLMMLLL